MALLSPCMPPTPAPSTFPSHRPVPLWWTVACLCMVLVPFVLTLHAIQTQLRPSEYDDSFAYVWRGPFNTGFLTNRSLTQRVLFWLCGNHLRNIARLQLAALAGCALTLFWLLAPRTRAGRALVALALALFFSSYGLSVGSVNITAEPIHLAFLLVLPALLFLGRGRAGSWATLGVGLLFIFSKNTAPFLLLLLLLLRVLLSAWGRLRMPSWRVYAVLTVAAVAAVGLLRAFDTSVHTNLANNVLGRMLTDPTTVQRLLTRDGLPPGDYVTACAGGVVLTPCFDGETLHDWHPEELNYRLRQDRWGFARWVATRGGGAYARYLLWDRPGETWREVWGALDTSLAHGSVAFTTGHLGLRPEPPDRSNLERLAAAHPARRVGFLGFDPAVLLGRALRSLGLGSPLGVSLLVLAGVALLRWRPSPLLALGVAQTVGAVGLFALAYVGDAMEVERHTFPALYLLCLGIPVLLASLGATLMGARGTVAPEGR